MGLEADVVHQLMQRRLTLALAESCTGGLVGHLVTNVPGSSACFIGSVVAYHNRVKRDLLGVGQQLLDQHGAVSEATARAMAEGVRRLMNTDIGVGITGITGPAGGSPERPVGLVYIAVANGKGTVCESHVWIGNREENKNSSAQRALAMVLEAITES